ncbi:hypothetical protein ACM01_42160 [Streptomyces viridochromogenes]|uniref:Uncharacterized protein n=1 Tax=Streptomyces viridochromogenes TaxID=1938 RepID=A0A0J7YWT2_STRVR|nr:hypothetical protein ACM01_42160 [Streptomyces viridochromogenes]
MDGALAAQDEKQAVGEDIGGAGLRDSVPAEAGFAGGRHDRPWAGGGGGGGAGVCGAGAGAGARRAR